MTVQLEIPPEMQLEAERLAELRGVSVEGLLYRLFEQFVAEERREDEILQARLVEANSGTFLTEAEMDVRFARMLERR